jgi:hypothetical protein
MLFLVGQPQTEDAPVVRAGRGTELFVGDASGRVHSLEAIGLNG